MQIRTANQQKIVRQLGGYRRFVEHCLRLRWRDAMQSNPLLRRIDWEHPQGEVQATIGRSDWRVDCPYCRGALVVEPGEPYFCPDCAMQGNDYKPLTVVFPANRAEIERVLLKRPDPETRNWLVGETVADLERENREHGIGA